MTDPEFTIHRAGEQSLAQLAARHDAGFAGYATPVHMDAQALADRMRSEHIDLWSSFTLRHHGQDTVLVLIARRGHRSRVASMGVPVGARRQGWGRRALQVAIDEAAGRGDSLQLEVLTDNTGAVALYESMGFHTRRTLLGFHGTLTPPRGSTGEARETTIDQAAARVAAHATDLPWQLQAASLHGLGPGWRAWTNGPAVAITKHRDDTLHLMSLLTDPEQRRRGHARTLLHQIARAEQTLTVRIISIVPAGLTDGFFHRCGLETSPLSQYEMVLGQNLADPDAQLGGPAAAGSGSPGAAIAASPRPDPALAWGALGNGVIEPGGRG